MVETAPVTSRTRAGGLELRFQARPVLFRDDEQPVFGCSHYGVFRAKLRSVRFVAGLDSSENVDVRAGFDDLLGVAAAAVFLPHVR